MVTKQWDKNDIDYAFAIAVDSTHNIYVGYDDVNGTGKKLRKLDTYGNEIWALYDENYHLYAARAVDLDGSEDVYILNYKDNIFYGKSISKYSLGNYVSSFDDTLFGVDMCIDKINNAIYTVYYPDSPEESNITVKKMSLDGTIIWSKSYADISNPTSICLDGNGSVCIGNSSGVTKFTLSGGFVWSTNTPYVQALTVDSEGNIYVGHGNVSEWNGFGLTKLDSIGNVVWTKSHEYAVIAVNVDDDDNIVYAVYGESLYKINKDGILFWSIFSWNNIRTIAFDYNSSSDIYLANFVGLEFGGFALAKYDDTMIHVTSVSIPESISVLEGQQAELSAAVLPANATYQKCYWKSSNVDIATVETSTELGDICLIEAVGTVGQTCDITVTTLDKMYTATCHVTIIDLIPVESVSVSPATANIVESNTLQLIATVLPEDASQNVTWSSSNTAIATVDSSGLVTGVEHGTCTITATTEAGGLTDTCEVTVTEITPASISVSPSTASVKKRATVQLSATVLPENAVNKNVTWSTGNTSVATVDSSGLVTGVEHGTCIITATTEIGGLTDTCYLTVTGTVPATSGMGIIKFNSGTEVPAWEVETERFTDRYMGKKVHKKVRVTAEFSQGSSMSIYISVDGGSYELIKTYSYNSGYKLLSTTIKPRRCDSFKLKLTGSGDVKVFELERELDLGSDR